MTLEHVFSEAVGEATALALDLRGRPVVAFVRAEDQKLCVARRGEAGWTVDVVAPIGDGASEGDLGLVVGRDGRVTVAFFYPESESLSIAVSGESWTVTRLAAPSNDDEDLDEDLQVSSAGHPIMLVPHGQGALLAYRECTGTGSVVKLGPVDGAGEAHAVYAGNVGHFMALCPSDGGHALLFSDAGDDGRGPWLYAAKLTESGVVKKASRIDGSSAADAGETVRAVTLPSGALVASYKDSEGAWRVADTLTDGKWKVTKGRALPSRDGSVSGHDIAVRPDGGLALAWVADVDDVLTLSLATRDEARAFSKSVVVSTDVSYTPALRLAVGDETHLVFRDDAERLVYARMA
jgi:hypothetical protein